MMTLAYFLALLVSLSYYGVAHHVPCPLGVLSVSRVFLVAAALIPVLAQWRAAGFGSLHRSHRSRWMYWSNARSAGESRRVQRAVLFTLVVAVFLLLFVDGGEADRFVCTVHAWALEVILVLGVSARVGSSIGGR